MYSPELVVKLDPAPATVTVPEEPENNPRFASKAVTAAPFSTFRVPVPKLPTFKSEKVPGVDPALGSEPSPIYAATLRMRYEDRRRMMDNWYHPLAIGQPLPTLPIWLTEPWAVSLDLESSYEETCRTLRIR